MAGPGSIVTPIFTRTRPTGGVAAFSALGEAEVVPDWTEGPSLYQNYKYQVAWPKKYRDVVFKFTITLTTDWIRPNGTPYSTETTIEKQYAATYDDTLNAWTYEALFHRSYGESAVQWSRGSAFWTEDSTSSLDVTNQITSILVVPFAYTDLLVNSATVGSPVRLVFDPATHLLVADY